MIARSYEGSRKNKKILFLMAVPLRGGEGVVKEGLAINKR